QVVLDGGFGDLQFLSDLGRGGRGGECLPCLGRSAERLQHLALPPGDLGQLLAEGAGGGGRGARAGDGTETQLVAGGQEAATGGGAQDREGCVVHPWVPVEWWWSLGAVTCPGRHPAAGEATGRWRTRGASAERSGPAVE